MKDTANEHIFYIANAMILGEIWHIFKHCSAICKYVITQQQLITELKLSAGSQFLEVLGDLTSYCLENLEVINTPKNQAFFNMPCKKLHSALKSVLWNLRSTI